MAKKYDLDPSKESNKKVIQKTVETLYEKEGIEVTEDLVEDVIKTSQLDLLLLKIREGYLETVKFPYLFKFKANVKKLNKITKEKLNKLENERLGVTGKGNK